MEQSSSLEVYNLAIDLVNPPGVVVRSVMDEDALMELADSIREVGILNPLIVRRLGDRYEIVAGHRRYLAARGAGLATVRCIVLEGGEQAEDLAKLHENAHREELNPVDEAEMFRGLVARYGWSVGQLAEKSGKSVTYVYDRLALLEIDEKVREAVKMGKISLAVAKELSKVDDDSYRKMYLEAAVTNGVTARQAAGWRLEYQRVKGRFELDGNGDSGQEKIKSVEEYKLPCLSCLGETDANTLSSMLLCAECWEATSQVHKVWREGAAADSVGEGLVVGAPEGGGTEVRTGLE